MKKLLATLTALALCIGLQTNAQDLELSIPILPEVSQLEKDQQIITERIDETAQAINHLAAKMQAGHAKTWSLPDDRLLALLNANPPYTRQMQEVNDQLARFVNAYLDALNSERYQNRAPIGLGRDDVEFDEASGLFVIIPPEDPPAEH